MAEKEAIPLSSDDLGDGSLDERRRNVLALNLTEMRRRLARRLIIFWIGIIFVLVFSFYFLCFSHRVLAAIEDGHQFDWHILLVGTGLIVPATLVLFALIRYSFIRINGDAKADSSDARDFDGMSRLVDALSKFSGKN